MAKLGTKGTTIKAFTKRGVGLSSRFAYTHKGNMEEVFGEDVG
jgi:hypothetical protein